jgi:hypothetical protein
MTTTVVDQKVYQALFVASFDCDLGKDSGFTDMEREKMILQCAYMVLGKEEVFNGAVVVLSREFFVVKGCVYLEVHGQVMNLVLFSFEAQSCSVWRCCGRLQFKMSEKQKMEEERKDQENLRSSRRDLHGNRIDLS